LASSRGFTGAIRRTFLIAEVQEAAPCWNLNIHGAAEGRSLSSRPRAQPLRRPTYTMLLKETPPANPWPVVLLVITLIALIVVYFWGK
jgi:hypothetical protein